MTRIIGFSIGTLWSWTKSKNRNKLVDFVRKTDIEGVELMFNSAEDLYNFKLSKKNEKWLKSLKYVSIHAPSNSSQSLKDEVEKSCQLEIMYDLYKKINAQNLIIHAKDLPSLKILNKFDMQVSTENMEKNLSIMEIEKILKDYPKMGLCLDVSHAYYKSKKETEKLVKKFRKHITQIHFSGTYKKKLHLSLREVNVNFMNSIKPIFKLDVPIIIEENMFIKSKKYLKEEIDLVRKIFKK